SPAIRAGRKGKQFMQSTANSSTEHPSADGKSKTVQILVNDKPVRTDRETTGAQILTAAELPADFKLFEIRGDKEIAIAPDERLKVHEGQRFLAAPTLDPGLIALPPVMVDAVASVRSSFPCHVVEDGQPGDGTVLIVVRSVDIGADWDPSVVDLEVRLQPS